MAVVPIGQGPLYKGHQLLLVLKGMSLTKGNGHVGGHLTCVGIVLLPTIVEDFPTTWKTWGGFGRCWIPRCALKWPTSDLVLLRANAKQLLFLFRWVFSVKGNSAKHRPACGSLISRHS